MCIRDSTSSLDAISEEIVFAALRRLRAGRTTVVIAHRLSTIVNADNILVLDSGQLVEQGTHGELMDRNGLYASLWNRQREAERAREELAQALEAEKRLEGEKILAGRL